MTARSRVMLRAATALALSAALGPAAWAAPGAADDTPPLPPPHQRPVVVVDSIMGAGLLTPSAQETTKAVGSAFFKRYGGGMFVLEDEAINIRKLRRMSRNMGALMPPDADRTQRGRLALLEWALKEAPVRVKITFTRARKKGGGYVAAAECRRTGDKAALHRVEGTGQRYEDAVTALEPHLATFCGVLDGVMAERKKGRIVAPGAAP